MIPAKVSCRWLHLALTVCLVFLGIGCGSKVSGVYYREYSDILGEGRYEWDFRSDGTVLWKQRFGASARGSYKVAGDTITAEYQGESGAFSYRIEGRDLIDQKGNRLRRMQ